jgi:hypothetical protein
MDGINMFDVNATVRVLRAIAKQRTEKADENRRLGIPDPLNDLVDAFTELHTEGKLFIKPLRKSQKHRKRKRK